MWIVPPSLCQNATISIEQNTATHAITSDLKDGAIFVLVVIMQLVEVMLPGQLEGVRSGVAPV